MLYQVISGLGLFFDSSEEHAMKIVQKSCSTWCAKGSPSLDRPVVLAYRSSTSSNVTQQERKEDIKF